MQAREPIVRDLTRRLRGGDFRQAVKAVAALRHLGRACVQIISSITPDDEQRAFQLLVARLVAEGGVHGLASRWSELPSAHWREMLVSEIGQAVHLWVDEGTIELLLAALDDPEVARQAVGSLIECMRERPDAERRNMGKTLRGKAALDAWERMAAWITPARRARVAKAVTAALERCAANPRALTWPDKYIERTVPMNAPSPCWSSFAGGPVRRAAPSSKRSILAICRGPRRESPERRGYRREHPSFASGPDRPAISTSKR
jgi:hypothetical protein